MTDPFFAATRPDKQETQDTNRRLNMVKNMVESSPVVMEPHQQGMHFRWRLNQYQTSSKIHWTETQIVSEQVWLWYIIW